MVELIYADSRLSEINKIQIKFTKKVSLNGIKPVCKAPSFLVMTYLTNTLGHISPQVSLTSKPSSIFENPK